METTTNRTSDLAIELRTNAAAIWDAVLGKEKSLPVDFMDTANRAAAALNRKDLALRGADRIELLRDQIDTMNATIRSAGRTTSAESTIIARRNIEDYRAEIKTIRAAIRAALEDK